MEHPQYEADDLTGTRFERVLARLRDQPRLNTIERVQGLTGEQFREFAAQGYPAIFTDMISPVPTEARMKGLLNSAFGKQAVEARYGEYAQPVIYVNDRSTRLATMNSILENLELEGAAAKEHLYLARMELDEYTARFLDITPPPYYRPSELCNPCLWLGPAGCVTPLHKDNSDNFTFHFFGRKRWVLFPVRDYPYLYMNQPLPHSVPGFSCSRIDVRDPDYASSPLYREAHPIEAELGPGEVLYLPAGWAHYVETLSTSLMINYWVLRRPACLDGEGKAARTTARSPQRE